VERDKSNLESADENISTFGSLTQAMEKEQSRTRQDSLTEISTGEKTFMEHISSVEDTCHRQNRVDSDRGLLDMQTAFSERYRNVDMPSSMEEQPLDCTSDMNQLQQTKTKHEPLDYTVDIDTESRYKTYMAEKILYNPEENLQRQGSDLSLPLCRHLVL